MAPGNLRGLSFRTSAGETVRVHDCICWRHLEARPCRTAQECQVAQNIDVVVIPVVPSGYGSSKRARKAVIPTTTAALPPAASAGATPGIARDGLLSCCATAQTALEASGLRATVDDCTRQTPGAKYHTWENRGVGLRVEVGSREATSGTFCLALHPNWAYLMPLATSAVAAVTEALPHAAVHSTRQRAPAENLDGGGAATSGGWAGGRPNLRLVGLSPPQLVAACRAVLAGSREARIPNGARGGGAGSGDKQIPSGGSGAAAGAAAAAEAPAAAVAAAARSQWCRKLHLWPELVAGWGSTDACVATLLAELVAADSGAAAPQTGGGTVTGSLAAESCAAEGYVGQRPCVAHLRHLLQLGRPCYCGRGHYSLQQLQHEVERRFSEGWSGEGGQQQQTAVVVDWMAPPEPRAWQPRGQQERREGAELRRGPGGMSSGGGQTVAGTPATAAEAAAMAGVEAMDGGRGDFDGRNTVDDGDSDGDDSGLGDGGGRVVLLVGNIPPAVRAGVVQGELAGAFAPYGCCGVAVSRTRNGGSHGWARVSLAGDTGEVTAAAAAAVAALDGRLRLSGTPLTVSYSSGRLDTIFPYLPYVVRSAMRVDSVAAFSATDQATADKMTDLLAGLAEALLLRKGAMEGREAPPQLLPEARTAAAELVEPPAAATTAASAAHEQLLSLVLTDGTACCGGNVLSFLRRFKRVVAVELDPDRAEDLRHNAALVRAWDGFRRARQQQRQQQEVGGAATAAARALPRPPPHQGEQGPHAARGPPAERPASSAPAGRLVDEGRAADRGDGAWPAAGGGLNGALAAGGGPQEGGLGALEVMCGDYTRLMGSLWQDVVFVDPPWGGPQYGSAVGTAEGRPTRGSPAASGAVASRDRGAGRGGSGCKAMEYGDAAFMLGQEPMSYMVSELLVSGRAGMVALKLPSRADAELRAMQARVRQLVTARQRHTDRGARGSGATATNADAAAAAAKSGAIHECHARLLCAEVTLGRSALVVFLLLPYKYGSSVTWSDGGGSPSGTGLAGGTSVAAAVAGSGADSAAAGHGCSADSVRVAQPQPTDLSDEDDGDDTDDNDAEEGEGGAGARSATRRRSGMVEGCRACAGLGTLFRAALRDCCSRVGLPYRLVCD